MVEPCQIVRSINITINKHMIVDCVDGVVYDHVVKRVVYLVVVIMVHFNK